MLPLPPDEVLQHEEFGGPLFVAAEELRMWALTTFVAEVGELCNEDHAHLREADVCFLWTNVMNSKGGQRILGTAQLGPPAGGSRWSSGRAEAQLIGWFGRVPDFLITLDALWVAEKDQGSICALIEHELYHCAQAVDMYGVPKVNKLTGAPVWSMRPHDVEEFVGVVRRYGTDATRTQEFIKAALGPPLISSRELAGACGLCVRAS